MNTTDRASGEAKPFVFTRLIKASRDRVWSAYTEADQLQHWFAPKGFIMPTRELDLRPGGTFHFCIRPEQGEEMWGLWKILEVEAPRRLVYVVSCSDAHRGLTGHPSGATWPREIEGTATLEERYGKTGFTLVWKPVRASAEEQAAFDAGHDNLRMMFGGKFDQLEAYLQK